MQELLERLKLNSVGKLKPYNEPVNALAPIGDFVCSYVIEDGLVRQGVLTISHRNRYEFVVPGELQNAIESVFGMAPVTFTRTYPNRGYCIQYVFKVT